MFRLGRKSAALGTFAMNPRGLLGAGVGGGAVGWAGAVCMSVSATSEGAGGGVLKLGFKSAARGTCAMKPRGLLAARACFAGGGTRTLWQVLRRTDKGMALLCGWLRVAQRRLGVFRGRLCVQQSGPQICCPRKNRKEAAGFVAADVCAAGGLGRGRAGNAEGRGAGCRVLPHNRRRTGCAWIRAPSTAGPD